MLYQRKPLKLYPCFSQTVLSSKKGSVIRLGDQDLLDPISRAFYKKGKKFSFTIIYTSEGIVVRNNKGVELLASGAGDLLKGLRFLFATLLGGSDDETLIKLRELECE